MRLSASHESARVACRRMAELPLVRQAVAEFRRVTGFAVRLIPPEVSVKRIQFGIQEPEFCRLARKYNGCPNCPVLQNRLLDRIKAKLRPQQCCCVAGILQVAVPVVVLGRHVATLVGGKVQVADKRARFESICGELGLHDNARYAELVAAYDRVPRMSSSQTTPAVRLLDALARLLGLSLTQQCASELKEPAVIAKTRKLIREHKDGKLTTESVAKALGLNTSYFCRLFRRAAGMTFHAYAAQLRVEAAVNALRDTNQSITAAGFSAGFQSSSDFNRVFKAALGITPTEFRKSNKF